MIYYSTSRESADAVTGPLVTALLFMLAFGVVGAIIARYLPRSFQRAVIGVALVAGLFAYMNYNY